MTARSRALVAFVASLALLVGSVIAWATSQASGVGTDLAQVTDSSAVAEIDDTAPQASRGARAQAPANLQGPAEVPRVDATNIPEPEVIRPPRQLSIGSVGIDMPIRATGVLADGQMQLPNDPNVIGWYKFGAAPGIDVGSTVLGGHIDTVKKGVGPLARLAAASEGDRITVTNSRGKPVRYEVTSVQRIAKAALPVDRLFRPDGPHRLAVITCGGQYLPDEGGYEDNIVVLARPMTV
jgi:hypothetical protein